MDNILIKRSAFMIKIRRRDKNDKTEFNIKQTKTLENCQKFFSTKTEYMKSMLHMIGPDGDLSLRSLDWLVTNYSKKHGTYYKLLLPDGREKTFYIHLQYKKELSYHSKNYFDPFCRQKGTPIVCYYDKNDLKVKFVTSIAQLNFMKWAIKHKIVAYMENHIKEIRKEHKETLKENKIKKDSEKNIPKRKIVEDDEEDEFGMRSTSEHLKLSLKETNKKPKRQLLYSPKTVLKFDSNRNPKFRLD